MLRRMERSAGCTNCFAAAGELNGAALAGRSASSLLFWRLLEDISEPSAVVVAGVGVASIMVSC